MNFKESDRLMFTEELWNSQYGQSIFSDPARLSRFIEQPLYRRLPLVESFPSTDFVMSEPCLLALACIKHESDVSSSLQQRYTVTDEQTVVREVLQMLSGLPGRLYLQIDTSQQHANYDFEKYWQNFFPDCEHMPFKTIFVPRQDIILTHLSHCSLQSILCRFGQFGSMAFYLTEICRQMIFSQSSYSDAHPMSGPCSTMKAFFASVHGHLLDFARYLQELIVAILQGKQIILPPIVSITGLDTFNKKTNKSTVTLLSLEFLLRTRIDLIKDLCSLVLLIMRPENLQASNAQQARYLLQHLYTSLHESKISGDPIRFQLLSRLFSDAFAPYAMIMDDWLYHGSLASDVHGEFFVCCLDEVAAAKDLDQPELQYDGSSASSAEGSEFWQRFAIRLGGDQVHCGKLRSATIEYLTLSLDASVTDGYYTGMTIAIDAKGDNTLWETGMITAYYGVKRRATVEFGKKLALCEGRAYTVSTVAPNFLQHMAFHLLSAGKSLTVLLLERNPTSRLYDLVHRVPNLSIRFSSFLSSIDSEQINDPRGIEALAPEFLDRDKSSLKTSKSVLDREEKLSEDGRGVPASRVWDWGDDDRRQHKLPGIALFGSTLVRSDIWARPNQVMPFEFHAEHSSDGTALPCSSLSSFLSGWDMSAVASGHSKQPREDPLEGAPSVPSHGQRLSGRLNARHRPAPTGGDTLLVPQILDHCFLQHVKSRVDELNSALVNHLMQRHRLTAHLSALRRIFFMEAGDILHAFSLELFRKLDRGEAWGDAHALDVMLQSSLPPIPGVELGSVSAYMQDGAQRIATGSAPTSIMALDRLRLSYSVGWPLNLVIDPPSLAAYNAVMAFLMQIKRAKCALDHMRDKPVARPRRLGAPAPAAAAGADAPREGATALERYGAWNARYLLLRAELRHVVNNVENYIMSQIHGADAAILERRVLEATALDQVPPRAATGALSPPPIPARARRGGGRR